MNLSTRQDSRPLARLLVQPECVYEKSGANFKEFRPVIFASGGFRADFTQNSLLSAYSPEFVPSDNKR